MCLSPETFLHGSEGWSCWPHLAQVLPAWVFSRTVAGRGDRYVDAQQRKHLVHQAVFCLSLWRSLSTSNEMHLFGWKLPLLVSHCSASTGVLHGPLMAVGTSHTAVCAYVCVCRGVFFLCNCLFSLTSRKKMELIQPLPPLLCQMPYHAKMISFICFSFACSEWN